MLQSPVRLAPGTLKAEGERRSFPVDRLIGILSAQVSLARKLVAARMGRAPSFLR